MVVISLTSRPPSPALSTSAASVAAEVLLSAGKKKVALTSAHFSMRPSFLGSRPTPSPGCRTAL